jgi:hypothetical protein
MTHDLNERSNQAVKAREERTPQSAMAQRMPQAESNRSGELAGNGPFEIFLAAFLEDPERWDGME